MIFIYSVELIFLGLGCNNYYQANIEIYDGNCLVLNKKTYNGRLKVYLKCNKKYRIITSNGLNTINNNLYIIPNIRKYYYVFSNMYYINSSQSSNKITFLLSDANYINLPIEKGEMILWQKQ